MKNLLILLILGFTSSLSFCQTTRHQMNSLAMYSVHGEHDSVIHYASQYMQADSLNQELWRQRAQSKFQLKDTIGAIDDYKKCISLDSTNLEPMLQLAMLYRYIKDNDTALEICEYVLSNSEKYRIRALGLKGSIHIRANQIESAIECYEDIVNIKPNAHYLYTLGLLYSSIGDFEKTLDYLKEVKEAKDFKKGMYPDLESYIAECETKLYH